MRKFPIGPTMVALTLLGLIGACLLLPAKKPPDAQTFSVVTAPGTVARVAPPSENAMAGAPVPPGSPTATPLAPGEDPPAPREPGAINYADKGVLPAL